MASQLSKTLPAASTIPRLPPSNEATFEERTDPRPDSQPTRLTVPARSLSIKFADAMDGASNSHVRRSDQIDENTPIRAGDGHGSRTYNTADGEQGRSTKTPKPVAATDSTERRTDKSSWLKRMADKYGSITLDNKGSVARDHLALERTFLAWLRTSLAFASIGIAITQLFRLNTSLQARPQDSIYPSVRPSLPLSPLLGHGLPPDLVPLLQQLAQASAQVIPTPIPTNTLLDQLLLMTPNSSGPQPSVHVQAFNDQAAAKLRRIGKPLGATFIGVSIVVLLVGFHRYFEAQYWIIRGKFPASRGSVALTGLIAGALIVASLTVVLVISPVSYEKR